jgi:hypothetical protein
VQLVQVRILAWKSSLDLDQLGVQQVKVSMACSEYTVQTLACRMPVVHECS